VWLDHSNDWIYRHIHHAETKLHELVSRLGSKDPSAAPTLIERALTQAGRELLLAQSSDWAFIMKTGTAVSYAETRVRAHLQRFNRLVDGIDAGNIDEAFVSDCEARDNLFPSLDPRLF
jgi:1,4-alpha-glucan branching enzyme